MEAYRITEWYERYEVSYKGGAADPDDKLKAGKLSFVRLKVHGHSMGAGFRRMKKVAGFEKAFEVFGFFCYLLEIAGNSKAGLRGWLLNEKGVPATDDDLAFILDAPIEQVTFALQTLIAKEVSWIELVLFPETPRNSAKLPDSRCKQYILAFGSESWELDALDPHVLTDLIKQHVAGYTNPDKIEEKEIEQESQREILTKISINWDKVAKFLD